MNYRELKKLVDKDISKNIYICNFFTCKNKYKMKSGKIISKYDMKSFINIVLPLIILYF